MIEYIVDDLNGGWHSCVIRGHDAIWDSYVGETLKCRREYGNTHDLYTMAML